MMKKPVLIAAATALVALTLTAGLAVAKGGPGPRGAVLERMFDELDANQDGAITKAEITEARAAHFAEADADGDGMLTAEEMESAAAARENDRRARRIEARIERLDTDGDGMLSLAEMTAEGSRIDRMFDRVDANDDGTITKAEAEAAKLRRGEGRGKSN